LIAGEKQAQLLKINIIVMIFNIVWNLILIPKYSFMWAGITTVLSQMLLCILTYYFANKLIKIRLPYLFMLCSIGISATIFLIFG
jgi:O-antigen/teichoic acid export membrane protein